MQKVTVRHIRLFAITVLALSVLVATEASQGQKAVTATQVNGTWRLRSGYQDNEFRIIARGRNKLKVEFEGFYIYRVNGERTVNTGTASGEATIVNNVATFKPDETEDCTITMKFVRGKLLASQEGMCDFGFNVRADGVYRRVSRKAS